MERKDVHSQMKSTDRRAFTLIELLVVIAIISLLAAILFPVFARARESARRASCLSNVRQMGMASMMYVQDHDETYPWAFRYKDNTGTDTIPWQTILEPYTKNPQVALCPSSHYVPPEGYKEEYRYGNYGANDLIFAYNGREPVKLAAIQSAANTYMLMDAGRDYIQTAWWVDGASNHSYIPGIGDAGLLRSGSCNNVALGVVTDCQSGRHFGGINVAFADGHAKWLKTEKVVGEYKKTDPEMGAWNPAN